jgi:methyltransferase (TIGR00027 family)
MEDAKPSRTAMVVALIRAEHANAPTPLFFDRWAEKLVPQEFRSELPQVASGDGSTEEWLSQSGLRVNVILRARYCEDQLREAASKGVDQYVIVGAGFDSFAWRRPAWARDVRVFEIDHPATQNVKMAQLAAAGADLGEACFVSADLREVPIDRALSGVDFDPRRRTFFAWLGVTRYLTREANASALAAMGRAAAEGSFVLLSYAPRPTDETSDDRVRDERSATVLSSWGEPHVSYFTAAEMAALVEEAEFAVREDLSHQQLISRYKHQGAEALGRARTGRLMLAERSQNSVRQEGRARS